MPLLVVITVLATVQNSRPPAMSTAGTPFKPHWRINKVPLPAGGRLFSADLPPGPPFAVAGNGLFTVVPGHGPLIGSGRLYRYTVEVEQGVLSPSDQQAFARLVEVTLSDPRSWTNPRGDGIAVQRVDYGAPDFRVTLVSQATARRMCGYDQGLRYDTSCRVNRRTYLNVARWVRGAVAFHGDIENYRRYAINHEVGHVFGRSHVPCPRDGALAPVMMQQTLSVSNDELHELNSEVQQGDTPIPDDGAVCRPSAWPFPANAGGE
jgi:hypothetical protein